MNQSFVENDGVAGLVKCIRLSKAVGEGLAG
jgi:hypothetical protein